MSKIELEFENTVLRESLNVACSKLYELGYCVANGHCNKARPNCKLCMSEFFTQKSFSNIKKKS